ncbi:MAG: putative zinc-binding protein [Chloroflexota bacterium]|nr:putative zinc-binding protein [Chloroflexota bacterium]
MARQSNWKLLIFTCYGGCATGVAASKACIRLWGENPDDVKIGCLPAVIVPWKLNEIMKSEKRILIDACGVQCGKKLTEREGMPVDRYIELTSEVGIRKVKRLPSEDLEREVYMVIRKEVDVLLENTSPGEDIGEEELLVAFGTDDGESLNDDHVGMAKYFYVYRFSDNRGELIEQRENVKFKGDESMIHGDPEKARATSSVLQGIDVLVGRKFGPNLPRLLKKFVCVVVRTESLSSAIESINDNMDRIVEEKGKEENRKHIVLRV